MVTASHRKGANKKKPIQGYEDSDAPVRLILLVGGGLFAAVGLSIAIVCGILFWIIPNSPRQTSTLTASLQSGEPGLEVSPAADRQDLQIQNQARIDHYVWIDRQAMTARIPVTRAMMILAEHGWPDQDRGGGAK